jgi:uncharacterized protein YaaW (UPF0174 family)
MQDSEKIEELESKISILTKKVNQQEEKISFLSQQLDFAINSLKINDPHGSLAKSRLILEKIVYNVYSKEMNEEPKYTELHKTLCNNQFTNKIEKRILARMNSVREMANLGTHGDKVTIKDASAVLESLSEIVEWYFDNYTEPKQESVVDLKTTDNKTKDKVNNKTNKNSLDGKFFAKLSKDKDSLAYVKYREDPDLEMLQYCDNEDLEILVKYLIFDKDGEQRVTQHLLMDEQFKKCNGDFKSVWKEISGELQTYGANTIATMFRGGKGVQYKQILENVCKRMDVKFKDHDSVMRMENSLIIKITENAIHGMNDEQKMELNQRINLNVDDLKTETMIKALHKAYRSKSISLHTLTVLIADSTSKVIIGTGLLLTARAILGRSLFLGPIGILAGTLLTIPMFSGPAYRVTIPCVIQIAYMRQKLNSMEEVNDT